MNERKISVLLVDDDKGIVDGLKLYLSESGFDVHVCYRGDEAVTRFSELRPDVVLLDINIPGLDGISVLKQIRVLSSVPVLMLSARDDQGNISASFEYEADDYIGKPFSAKEVIMRIRAIMRRGAISKNNKWEIVYKNLRLLEGESCVIRDGRNITLTKSEFQILKAILECAGEVVSRDDLMKEMWYANFLYGRTIDTHIKNIRHKVGEDVIVTVRGIGYRIF